MADELPLSEQLKKYHQAIESEFSVTPGNDANDAQSTARTTLISLLPEATKALEQLLLNADSDAVRLQSVKLVFEHALGKAGAEDELTKLINSLTVKKPATEPNAINEKQ
jgi:hypothetical protein